MNDHQQAARNAGMTESAFGRPALWRTAWPALAVGLCAFLLAVYGTWWLPGRLPAQYVRALEQSQQRYQQIADKSKANGGQTLIEVAGNIDVIFSRLVDLENNSPQRYWQWAEFQQAHADLLNESLKDPALSLSPPLRERWTEQAQHFRSKSHEILEQLAVRPSELQARAMLQVAHRKYRQGLGEFGVREAGKLAEEVARALDSADSTAGSAAKSAAKSAADLKTNNVGDKPAPLTADEIEAGQLLLVQLHMEAAWQAEAGSNLTCDTTRLDQALMLLERFQSQHENVTQNLEWQAARRLLMALTQKDLNAANNYIGEIAEGKDGGDRSQAWKRDLAKLQLSAIDGAWIEVAGQLRSRNDPVEPAVSSGLARTICRLAVSPLALAAPAKGVVEAEVEKAEELNDAERRATMGDKVGRWVEGADLGVLMAVQLGAHLPECSELFWECARIQAGQGSKLVVVPTALPQSIMSGQSGWLKHSLAALSATLDGQAAVASKHLQLLSRARGSPSFVARVALWRTQRLAVGDAVSTGELNQQSMTELKRLRELLDSIVQLEPGNGLNWFVLGTLQYRTEEFAAMRRSLDKARELLGDVPAIEQMLDAAEGIATMQ